jgi:hypothetical protein
MNQSTQGNVFVSHKERQAPMKDTNENGASKMLSDAINIAAAAKRAKGVLRMLPVANIAALTAKRSQPAAVAPAVEPEETPEEYDEENDGLKTRFQTALIGHCKAEVSLSAVVVELIAADIDRETAIEWGVEAGLSESYVQSTVSRLFIELTGERKKRVGGGRKPNKGAAGFAERAMKACDDDVDKALALLLAARRLLEKWEKDGTVDTNLKKLRSTKSA